MHTRIVQQAQENIAISEGVVGYFFDVKPLNSLFTNEAQVTQIVDLFIKKMVRINMPGQIVIRATSIDVPAIVEYYQAQYRKGGLKPFRSYAEGILNDIYNENKNVKYKYSIAFIFVEGRENFEISTLKSISLKKHVHIDIDTLEYAEVVNDHIYAELCNGLSCKKMSAAEVESLINYLCIPVEKKVESYYYTPNAQVMEYEYKLASSKKYEGSMDKVFTRNIMISKLPSEKESQTNIFNAIQLLPFPVDIILKFDIIANKDFIKKMQKKEVDILKSAKRELKNKGFTSDQIKKKSHLITAGIQGENADEKSKVKFQIMCRLRANTFELLIKRYNHLQIALQADIERDEGIQIAYEVGYQEEIASNLNPFDITYTKHVHLTDISYLAKLNWLGGLYIGEEKEGIILGYTRPGRLPVLCNPYATIEGKAKKTAPIWVLCGESGSGKSQLMNNILIELLAVFGIKVLVIDPKGDRYKFFEQMPAQMAQNLVIGSEKNQRGIFDPFNNYEPEKAIDKATNLAVQLGRAVNEKHEINLSHIAEAFKKCEQLLQEKKIKKITMTEVAKALAHFDQLLSDNLLSLANKELGYLFFAHHDKEVVKFDLSYSFNLITFAEVPNVTHHDKHNLEHQLFLIFIEEMETLVNRFMRMNEGSVKALVIDEVHVFKSTTNGSSVVENLVRLARSFMSQIILADQRFNTFDTIRDQASQVFIGSIASGDEIEEIIKYYNLSDNDSIRNTLTDKTKAEGFEKDELYRFLYIDYNNRKGIIRAELHSQFKEAFDTRKKEDEKVENSIKEVDLWQ